MDIKIIVAVAQNLAIGLNNNLPWHLPNDFKYFKQTTLDSYCIMGRRSFESLGKPLPNRTNVVVTRQASLQLDGATVVNSLQAGIDLAKANHQTECFIIGGAQIYAQALAMATHFYITKVHGDYRADTFFPPVNWQHWHLQWQQHHPADDRHKVAFTFERYERV